jgi:succinoglycan biosynthesis protein ExoV
MKLFYYRRPDGLNNFGDSLNPWLWERSLPGFCDDDDTTALIGIGTLLNNQLPRRVPAARKLIIFSTGAGYEGKITSVPENWQIICVRGKLTARQLGLPDQAAVTDGALLVRRFFRATGEKKSAFAFMPHIHHAKTAGEAWAEVCRRLGFQYIDPAWPVEKVLAAIDATEILLAEAMHGAIVADALRVPWISTLTSPRIPAFKWRDWCSSLGLTYRPRYILPLWEFYPRHARGLRSGMAYGRYCLNWFVSADRSLSSLAADSLDRAAEQLQAIALRGQPDLSDDSQLEALTVELEERLSRLRHQ